MSMGMSKNRHTGNTILNSNTNNNTNLDFVKTLWIITCLTVKATYLYHIKLGHHVFSFKGPHLVSQLTGITTCFLAYWTTQETLNHFYQRLKHPNQHLSCIFSNCKPLPGTECWYMSFLWSCLPRVRWQRMKLCLFWIMQNVWQKMHCRNIMITNVLKYFHRNKQGQGGATG